MLGHFITGYTKPLNDAPEIHLETVVGEKFYFQRAFLTTTASLTPFLLSAQVLSSRILTQLVREYGILEDCVFSLIHPVVMLALFMGTGYAGYVGWQRRRVRTIHDEIDVLKKQVPATVEGLLPLTSGRPDRGTDKDQEGA